MFLREQTGWMQGGVGIIISRSVVEYLKDNLYTKKCPFAVYNDVTVGRCIKAYDDVIIVHNPYLIPWKTNWSPTLNKFNLPVIRDTIALHYLADMHGIDDCLKHAELHSTSVLPMCR